MLSKCSNCIMHIFVSSNILIFFIGMNFVSIIGVKISPNIIDKLDNNVPAKLHFVPFFIFKKTDLKILVLHCNQDG